jgi:hypothetical protein
MGEAFGVACDECLTQPRLAREVVVETGLGDRQLGGNIRVAEAIEATDLNEPFGDIKDAGARVPRLPACACAEVLRDPEKEREVRVAFIDRIFVGERGLPEKSDSAAALTSGDVSLLGQIVDVLRKAK